MFALGGSTKQSSPPILAAQHIVPAAPAAKPKAVAAPVHRAAPVGFGSIVTPSGLVVEPWQASSSNVKAVTGRVLLNGAPVAGAHVVVDGYPVPQATAKDGSFPYDVDITMAGRHHVSVRASRARPCTATRSARGSRAR